MAEDVELRERIQRCTPMILAKDELDSIEALIAEREQAARMDEAQIVYGLVQVPVETALYEIRNRMVEISRSQDKETN